MKYSLEGGELPIGELMEFLEIAHRNQCGNRARFPEPYRLIERVDDCFVRGAENLIDPKPAITGLLFLRSQYAYKAAAGTSLSGQVAESFPMMRSCLEYAGYALVIKDAPSLQQVFLNRHVDDASKREQRAEFTIGKTIAVIGKFDAMLATIFKGFYDRTIDFGAHPNPVGMLTTLKMEKSEGGGTMVIDALTIEPEPLLHAMKTTAQVGLTALFVFQHIFKAKFDLLGISEEMDTLRRHHL
jgi:hypothetical protein